MALCSYEDAIVLTAGALLLIVNAGKDMWHLRGVSRAGLYAAARRHYRRVCKRFAPEPQSSPPDVQDELFRKTLHGKRTALAKGTYAHGCHILCLAVVIIMLNTVQQASRWMTSWQTIIVLVVYGMCIFIDAMPGLLSGLLDTYYGVCMVGVGLFVWSSSPDYITFSLNIAWILRMMLSVSHLRANNVLFWNIAAFCTGCSHAWIYSRSYFRLICMYEFGGTVALLLAASAIREWTFDGVRRDIRVRTLESEVSASMSLLEMLCDVVVGLTAEATIAGDSRAMAALLMRNSGASLADMSFRDLMPDEADQIIFGDMLTATGAGQEPSVGSCRVHLADSLSHPVHVEVFSVRVDRPDHRYMLGIRELTDVAEMPSFPRSEARRCREPAQRGTPRSSEPSSLPSRGLPAAAAAPQTPRPGNRGCLRYPDLLPTRQDVRCRGLVMAVSEWNIEVPRTMCCSYHAYVMDIKAIVRDKLSQVPCMASFPDANPTGVQCQACGIFYSADDEACAMCGSDDARPLPERVEEV